MENGGNSSFGTFSGNEKTASSPNLCDNGLNTTKKNNQIAPNKIPIPND